METAVNPQPRKTQNHMAKRQSKTHKAADSATVLEDAKSLEADMQRNQVPAPEPGNETKLGGSRRKGRPQPLDLPHMNGEGVEKFTDKKLDKIGDDFIDVRDRKALLAGELSDLEKDAAERMTELGVTRYTFSDQEMVLKPGKTHVKVKTVKVEGANGD